MPLETCDSFFVWCHCCSHAFTVMCVSVLLLCFNVWFWEIWILYSYEFPLQLGGLVGASFYVSEIRRPPSSLLNAQQCPEYSSYRWRCPTIGTISTAQLLDYSPCKCSHSPLCLWWPYRFCWRTSLTKNRSRTPHGLWPFGWVDYSVYYTYPNCTYWNCTTHGWKQANLGVISELPNPAVEVDMWRDFPRWGRKRSVRESVFSDFMFWCPVRSDEATFILMLFEKVNQVK